MGVVAKRYVSSCDYAFTFRQNPSQLPIFANVPAKKNKLNLETLSGPKLVKEVNRRIRVAMKLWDAHRNAACRSEREKALVLYNRLTEQEKEGVPQQLRVWLRYRSEKYFGEGRAGNGANSGNGKKKVKKGGGKPAEEEDFGEWP